jgi:hypothetical protein
MPNPEYVESREQLQRKYAALMQDGLKESA